MTNNIPEISFITICYNGFKDTCELIESLQNKIHSIRYETIVVDNASREDEAAKIRERYPSVIAIRSNENKGFSGGNNIGIREAKGKYIFLINNDTYIEQDTVSFLIERLESRAEIGGVSPKIRFAFPPQNIQFAGFTPLTPITLRNAGIGFGCPDNGTFDTPHPTPYLHGAAMLVKREVIEKVDNVGAASDVEIVQEEEKPYGYRVQFTLKIDERKMNAFNLDGFINELKNLPGKNVDVAQKDNKVIGNVDTLKPGNALNTGLRFGEFTKVTVVNTEVSEEEKEEEIPMAPAKEMALISVAAGDGIKDMFLELNCDHVVSGGQTMNPATEDIVKAIKGVNAKHVIILPNNSNIVMTAQQAATVLEGEVDVVVLPTKTIPQGLSAAIMYNPEATLDENVDEMKEAIANVKTGQVTFAIKDTSIDGLEIKANNYMALCEKKIVACVPDKLEALKNVLSNLVDEDSEIVTLICGEDVTEEEQEAARSFIEENYEDVECEVHVGKQPVYSFIVGVE